jgi:YD repeat-containing protein
VAFVALYCLIATQTAHAQSPTDATYTYSSANRLTSVTTPSGSTTFVYDAAGNLTASGVAVAAPLSLSPPWSSTTGANRVIARGAGFDAGVMVLVDGIALPPASVTVLDPRTLSVMVPPHAPGACTVTVQFVGGTTLHAVLTYVAPAMDTDADGMSDEFEAQFGLDGTSAGDASADADADGRTNLEEALDGTHPRGGYARYLAEGATSAFFDTVIALANPGDVPATTLLRFLRGNSTPLSHVVSVPPTGRATVRVKDVPGMATAEFSTVVESDVPVVVDRTMVWNAMGYGSHSETSLPAPATRWYLAEGSTKWKFDLYYLLQNPSLTADAEVKVTYLLPAGRDPIVEHHIVPANGRYNIHVDERPGLAETDVSAVFEATNSVPILVERAMYVTDAGRFFDSGHDAAAITAPASRWFLAEGATLGLFDTFILLSNPNPTPTTVRLTYLLEDGQTLVQERTLPANSRDNVWTNYESFPDQVPGLPLSNTGFSTVVESLDPLAPVIVERSMWWPQGAWTEGHDSAGSTSSGVTWVLADGEEGGVRNVSTWVLIANTSPYAGQARVTLLYEDGTTEDRTYPLAGNSRTTVSGGSFSRSSGQRFAVLIESVPVGGGAPAQVVVERAMYSDAHGQWWAAGSNAAATKWR